MPHLFPDDLEASRKRAIANGFEPTWQASGRVVARRFATPGKIRRGPCADLAEMPRSGLIGGNST